MQMLMDDFGKRMTGYPHFCSDGAELMAEPEGTIL